MKNEPKPLPSFLMDSGTHHTQAIGEVEHPTLDTYPTEAQLSAYPRESAIVISGLYAKKSEELNNSMIREADLRNALCNAVAAMEAAMNTSVTMARGERDACGRAPSHMAIQNVLDLSLFNIEQTTGINARGAA
jgi:hypothetical protein